MMNAKGLTELEPFFQRVNQQFPLSVYLAGKITESDWRKGICECSRIQDTKYPLVVEDNQYFDYEIGFNPISRKIAGYKVRITGPFFIDCNHGLAGIASISPHGVSGLMGGDNYHVSRACIDAINDSDVVFCWIDDWDCFGTIWEMGYAAGKGKIRALFFDPRMEEEAKNQLWFCRDTTEYPCANHDDYDNPTAALEEVVRYSVSELVEKKVTSSPDLFVESPIEAQLLSASWDWGCGLMLIPQWKFNGFRADFKVPGKPIVVECDGHDYHKSKEQRTHDASRDRKFQEAGIQVVRFTGTEIYQDVSGCIKQLESIVETYKEDLP